MTTEWHLVLSRDGTVLAATEGARVSWVGRRLDDCDDASEDLKEAGRRILDGSDHSASPVVKSVLLRSIQQAVRLTVIDALPLRRMPTDLRALLRSTLEILQRQAKAFDITLTVVVDDSVPAVVPVDAQKIAWATAVLVGNAIRYVAASTARSIQTGCDEDDAGARAERVGCSVDNAHIRLRCIPIVY